MDKCFFSCVVLKATPNRDIKNAGKWNERRGIFQISVSEIAESSFTARKSEREVNVLWRLKIGQKKTEPLSSVHLSV